MKRYVANLGIALMNFFSVIVCIFCGDIPSESRVKTVVRICMITIYFITLILMSIGDDDENINGKNDDLSDV